MEIEEIKYLLSRCKERHYNKEYYYVVTYTMIGDCLEYIKDVRTGEKVMFINYKVVNNMCFKGAREIGMYK